jgi:CCR4-NOT transcriptional regulation complex NOT5 subunit
MVYVHLFRRYTRGWFYHKEVRVWLTRIPNVEPLVKTPHYERGSYGCFDPNNWETIRKVWMFGQCKVVSHNTFVKICEL